MGLLDISMRLAFGTVVDNGLFHIAFRLLEAAKVDEFIIQNPDFEDEIKELSENDPSKKGKYLEWCVKQLKMKAKMDDLVPTITAFHTEQQRLAKKDINQYKTLKELENAIKDLPESKTKEKTRVKSEGSKKLWENETHALFRIETRNACIQYGKGTKWCITMKNHDYWEQYKGGNTVFYFLIDKRQTEPENENDTFSSDIKPNRYSKIAWAIQRGLEDNSITQIDIFDANDKKINSSSTLGIPEFSRIHQMVIDDAPSAPDGPIVSMRKGNMSGDELYDYLSSLDERDLNANLRFVKEGKFDLVLLRIVKEKQKKLSDDVINRIIRSIKEKSPEINEALMELARNGVKIYPEMLQRGPLFDEVVKLRSENDKDFFKSNDGWESYGTSNVRYIPMISDVQLRKELAHKYRGEMAENGYVEDKETLEKLLQDKDPNVRRSVLKGLKKQHELIESALNLVNDPDPSVRASLVDLIKHERRNATDEQGNPREVSNESLKKSRQTLEKLLQDEDIEVVINASSVDMTNVNNELLKKLAVHQNERVREEFQKNESINNSLKPINDESEIVRRAIVRHRKFGPEELNVMGKSEEVNDRRMALTYLKHSIYDVYGNYSKSTRDHYWGEGSSGNPTKKKVNIEFAKKFLNDEDQQVRSLANSILRIEGGKYDADEFENSLDYSDVIAWVGTNLDRANAVLEKKIKFNTDGVYYEDFPKRETDSHAVRVIEVNKLMDYLSGKTETFSPNDNLSSHEVFNILPDEYLPILLKKLPIEGISTRGTWDIFADKLGKEYALEILNKIPTGDHAQTAITALFKKLKQEDIQKFMDSDNDYKRISAARYVDKSRLPEMIDDVDVYIRSVVADRIDLEHLPKMMNDADPKIRKRVAKRIPVEYLEKMKKDKSITVRNIVKNRLGIASLSSRRLLMIASSISSQHTSHVWSP